jgi:hypothetical protein
MSNSSTEARMLLALQALQNNPKLSVRRAADTYEVPRNQRSSYVNQINFGPEVDLIDSPRAQS